jgi:hypothetical protein
LKTFTIIIYTILLDQNGAAPDSTVQQNQAFFFLNNLIILTKIHDKTKIFSTISLSRQNSRNPVYPRFILITNSFAPLLNQFCTHYCALSEDQVRAPVPAIG